MEWLDPADHRLWKADLMAGRVDLEFAAAVGGRLAAIHRATAGDAAVAAMFPTGPLFEALRLEPYLRATARRHPALAARLEALADRTAATKLALVHGDVSPKNIMAGPDGPVFLDAECAWYGDPAFDLAFCLNHLLLKCLAAPAAAAEFLDRLRRTPRRLSRRRHLGGARGAGGTGGVAASRPCSSPGWTASRRWNTSPATKSANASGASPCR